MALAVGIITHECSQRLTYDDNALFTVKVVKFCSYWKKIIAVKKRMAIWLFIKRLIKICWLSFLFFASTVNCHDNLISLAALRQFVEAS